ncbi:MAG: hypothetical protein WBA16_10460 [Nonlabens sp.]
MKLHFTICLLVFLGTINAQSDTSRIITQTVNSVVEKDWNQQVEFTSSQAYKLSFFPVSVQNTWNGESMKSLQLVLNTGKRHIFYTAYLDKEEAIHLNRLLVEKAIPYLNTSPDYNSLQSIYKGKEISLTFYVHEKERRLMVFFKDQFNVEGKPLTFWTESQAEKVRDLSKMLSKNFE